MKHTHRAGAFWALAITDAALLKFWDVPTLGKLIIAALAVTAGLLFIRDAVKI